MNRTNIERRLVAIKKQIAELEPLTPGEMCSLLGITYWRLRKWEEKGIFGDEKRRTGRGYPRRFSQNDAINGLLVCELMDITGTRRPIDSLKDLICDCWDYLSPPNYLVIRWNPQTKRWFSEAWGKCPTASCAIVLIPFWELRKKLTRFINLKAAG